MGLKTFFENKVNYAEKWRKLLRVAYLQGAVNFGEDAVGFYRHLGIFLSEEPLKTLKAEPFLKEMVCFNQKHYDEATNERKIEVDAAAWCAILNFEEIRTVGKPAFAMTNTYNGYHGMLCDRLEHSHVPEILEQWLEEIDG